MSSADGNKLKARVTSAAEAALAQQGYASAIDVLVGIGWLDGATLQRWRQGQLPSLEKGIQTKLPRISEAMAMFRAWATARGLRPSETAYVARHAGRAPLRFSASGDPAIEAAYRTHWVSNELSEKKRARVEAAMNRPPELSVYQPLEREWTCHRCGGTDELLVREEAGAACLACGGLGDLVFLPAGDAALSRRAKAASARYAVVVRFSRARKRYERQGLLVTPEALGTART